MTGSRAAIRYAKAILEMAQATGAAAQVGEDMTTIATTINNNKELYDFIHNPTVKLQVKQSALQEVFANSQTITQGLFRLLFENQRFEILNQIAEQYNLQLNAANGFEVATVTTAFEITPELEAKVLDKVKQISDKKVTLVNVVDPAIIGGFILRVGDKQYNASVASRLLSLKRELSN
jgi:F-type H+-transporting ATPase subunit delta